MTKKKKDEKVIYYDDNSTIVDMSGVKKKKLLQNDVNNDYRQHKVSEKEKIQTFFSVFKMMLLPTFIALIVIFLLYLLFYFIT